MSISSYSQNFEDVMLWRALHRVENGFYIDVGAWSPVEDSVTLAFYERGWRGINIEPNAHFHEQLTRMRSRDTNLRVAIGDKEGKLDLIVFGETGLSTLDAEIAALHSNLEEGTNRQQVDVRKLDDVWRQHISPDQPVHFLKIDVEGFERQVILGHDWKALRPWVVVVEATLPNSQQETHEDWEALLLDADYTMAYADGLNRYYVAEEHSDLLDAFKYPPNVFDELVVAWRTELASRIGNLETRADQAEHELRSMQNSWSWKITRPLRALLEMLNTARGRGRQ